MLVGRDYIASAAAVDLESRGLALETPSKSSVGSETDRKLFLTWCNIRVGADTVVVIFSSVELVCLAGESTANENFIQSLLHNAHQQRVVFNYRLI